MSSVELAIVVVGGGPLDVRAVRRVLEAAPPSRACVIAADSGVDHAYAAGLVPTLVVGDMDSISARGRRWIEDNRIPTVIHSPDKDQTDTELALAEATRQAANVIVLAGSGDRLDHTIAAVTALGAITAGSTAIPHGAGWWGATYVHALAPGGSLALAGPAGTVFSLLALHGTCSGVDVSGARWPLSQAALQPGSSLGVSNAVGDSDAPARIAVGRGVLTVIVPDGLSVELTPMEET